MPELDPRTNPAYLKLDLYCQGARLHESFFERGEDEDEERTILRTRAGLGSGLELVLPGRLFTNVPVTEAFAAESPYEVAREGGQVVLRRDNQTVCHPQLAPRPPWYDRKTTSGKPMTRVGSLQGTYLGVYPAKVCEYWLEKPDKSNCKFCSVGLNLGHDDADEKGVEEVMEVVRAARDESGISYVDFNTGHYEGETYLDILEPYIRAVKEETGLLVGVQAPPHRDLRQYDRLKAMGVNRVSFCFEIYDRGLFEEICPGKHREYGLDRYLGAVEYCAKLGRRRGMDFDPWVSNGEIIAGLEPPESSMAAIDHITAAGAIPTVCVFRPLKGTDYEDMPPPRTADMVPVFRHLYERCMERGLPIGVAPNVHVSLVMLPEECAALSPRRYWGHRAKLALARRVFARRFYRELDRKRARLGGIPT